MFEEDGSRIFYFLTVRLINSSPRVIDGVPVTVEGVSVVPAAITAWEGIKVPNFTCFNIIPNMLAISTGHRNKLRYGRGCLSTRGSKGGNLLM